MEIAEITPKDGVVQVVFKERQGEASPAFPLTHSQAIWFVSLMLQAIQDIDIKNKVAISENPFFAIRRSDDTSIIIDFLRKAYSSEASVKLDGPEILYLISELAFAYSFIKR